VSGPAIDLSVADGLRSSLADGRTAERLGVAGLWTAETSCDPFLAAVPALGVTTHTMVGTGVAIAFARSPMTIAQQAHDLQVYSGGRFVLGLGSQIKTHITKRYSMPWGRPIVQMREMVGAVRAIFAHWYDGARLEFEGEYYRHTFNAEPFRPFVPEGLRPPPIHLAAVGPKMLELTGEVADGYISHTFLTPAYLTDKVLPQLAPGKAKGGKAADSPLEIVLSAFAAVGSGEQLEKQVAVARRRIALYASTPAYRVVLDHHGIGALQEDLHTLSRAERWDEMAALIDDQVLDLFTVVGEPKEAAVELLARYGATATRIRLAAADTALAEALLDLTGAAPGSSAAPPEARPRPPSHDSTVIDDRRDHDR
jgi:probable F420-dependent oxidoreductase